MRADNLALRCPRCDARLLYVESHGSVHVYWCVGHGAVVLPPSGILRLAEPNDPKLDKPAT